MGMFLLVPLYLLLAAVSRGIVALPLESTPSADDSTQNANTAAPGIGEPSACATTSTAVLLQLHSSSPIAVPHQVHVAAEGPAGGRLLAATVDAATGFRTVVVLITLLCLALFSVAAYVSSETQADTAAPSADSHASAKDDSQLGLSTGDGHAGAGRALARRATVTIAELPRRRWTIEESVGTMSGSAFVVNMFADLCPPGFLPLAFGLRQTGYAPGLLLLICFYGLCVYTMWAIAKSMEINGAKDFAGQWAVAIGRKSAWVPVLVVALVCFGTILSYSCFFADIFAGVTPALGLDMSRNVCLLALTIFPTMPLCLLKDLSALSYSSGLALLAVLYAAGFMCWRAVDGSYAPGGKFTADLDPSFAPQVPEHHLLNFGAPSLVLVNTLAMAFQSHYNGCKYYRELKHRTPHGLLRCTATAMGISALLFAVTMVAGFKTFGSASDGVILRNYSRRDNLANAARVGVGLSIVASFPLMFSGLREAAIVLLRLLLQSRGMSAERLDDVCTQDALSMFLLALITLCASLLTDAGLVVGLVGAICGSAIIYVVPCTLFAASIKSFTSPERSFWQLCWLRCLTLVGVVLAVAGCATSVAM